MRKGFLHLTPIDEFLKLLEGFENKTGTETISTIKALGRVLGKDITSPIDLPDFRRSTVDGFGVVSSDTSGASSGSPVYLDLMDDIPVGMISERPISPGEAARVVTGGMVPDGADGVVMLEYTDLIDETTLEVRRGVGNLENVVIPGEDMRRGDVVVPAGRRLRPFDIGALTGVGIVEVEVFLRPRVSIFSSGDEVIEPDETPNPGQIRDVNKYAIAGGVEEAGGVPLIMENVSDELEPIKSTIKEGIKGADMVILSGGSSVGAMDYTLRAINEIGSPGVLVHGISIKPGKPTIYGLIDDTPIIGLPGHPVSAMIVFLILIAPFIRQIGGERDKSYLKSIIKAEITRNLPGSPGRESYFPVKLEYSPQGHVIENYAVINDDGGDIPMATPILGKSGMISILTSSTGLISIPAMKEGIKAGDVVDVILF